MVVYLAQQYDAILRAANCAEENVVPRCYTYVSLGASEPALCMLRTGGFSEEQAGVLTLFPLSCGCFNGSVEPSDATAVHRTV